jgi:1-pyrroline-5-carboxylate dehydrogenase
MHEALARVRREFGREYQLWIGGEGVKAETKLSSLNPSHPDEVVGVHQKATGELAAKAVESAFAFYPEWRRTSAELRAHMLLRVARILRERKLEFDAWLVYEAGKTWPEAEADVSEAIDFCEYYAREMLRYSLPAPVVQLPGERDELRTFPGRWRDHFALEFPVAILVGMTTAALVTGNTVVIKPSSDTPTIVAKFVEVLLEAAFHREVSRSSPAAALSWGTSWWDIRWPAS